jgi:hypothetical protein
LQGRVSTFEVLEDRSLLSTVQGMLNDGKTSIEYDPTTGAVTIQPDGNPVGLFDIRSASSILTGSATFPPGGILAVNTAEQKSWITSAANTITQNFSLGVIAPPGLALDFLLNDLTLVGSGGFGTPNVNLDLVYTPVDYGDLPDTAAGTGPGNYNTRGVDNGPRHTIVPGLRIGASVDGDSGSLQNAAANADDVNGALPDDEDGVVNPAADLVLTVGASSRIDVRVTNLTGSLAYLYAWIDYDGNGRFDTVATEQVREVVPSGTNHGIVSLFTGGPTFHGTTYARFRLTTDPSMGPTGPAPDGEVEDYRLTINRPGIGVANIAKNTKIASGTPGGPVLANGDMFGSAVAALGDLDGDGVEDLAVGAPSQTGSGSGGNMYVLFMNASGTVKASQRIGSGIGGGPTLASGDYFGHSVASLGDLDGDGITDLAVGASKDKTGGDNRGAVHVLFLNANGTVKRSQKIAHNLSGGPSLLNGDRFGGSITSLGDMDGDGVADLAVGAFGDDSGGDYRGAVHVLFMNANGTVKSSQKIASGIGGGPTLANADIFGIGVASLGDLDGDRVTDLAVGAFFDDTGGPGRGAVHVLFLNSNGTVKSSQKIASGTGGGPVLGDSDYFGRSVASLGDLDGDGVADLAVGAYRDDTGGNGRGALHVLLLNANGTVKQSSKIANNTGGGPSLSNDNRFGSGVASLGDLDGDGVIDLAVGAETDNTGGTGRGAVHVLYLRSTNTPPVITSPGFVNVPENTASVLTVTASDAEQPPQLITFSIGGGADQARFSITSGGVLTFNSPPNFEATADANGDNIYVVIVQANDGSGGTATQTINVTVLPVNDNSPVFTSPDSANVPENTTAVMTVTAVDADVPPETLAFSVIGGADQSRFSITPGGTLSFTMPPDFEAPTDSNGDNTYVVIVQASDGSRTSPQAILVRVTDVVEVFPDYNRNGSVDAADYVLWRNTLGQVVTPFSGADGSGNGFVDQADYNIWRANFGRTVGAAASTAASGISPTVSSSVRTHRPVRREMLVDQSTRDQALVAWLASRPAGQSREWTAAAHGSFRGEAKHEDDSPESIQAFDVALARLHFGLTP